MEQLSSFEAGLVLGMILDHVSFGGDRRQPHVVVKLSEKNKALLDWIHGRLPMGMLYGPYSYVYSSDGKARVFYQLMFRGEALHQGLMPLLRSYDWEPLAPEAFGRYQRMLRKYPRQFEL